MNNTYPPVSVPYVSRKPQVEFESIFNKLHISMKKRIFLILLLTNGSAFSQTTSDNYPIDTTIGVENKMDSSLIAATDTMQNFADMPTDTPNGSSIGTILLLVVLILVIIVVCIVIYQNNKKELAEIDAYLANAESAIKAGDASTARQELNRINNRIKNSDENRRKTLLDLYSRLNILDTNIRFDAYSKQMKDALESENLSNAHSAWDKLKVLKVIDRARIAQKDLLSIQLQTLKTNLEIDDHLSNAEIALRSKKVITARSELDSAKSLLTKVIDAVRDEKLEELSFQLEAVEAKLKRDVIEQLKEVREEVENGQFTDIESIKKKVQPTLIQETPKDIQNTIKSFFDEVEEQYKKGVIPEQTLDYVLYNASKLAVPNKEGYYCYTLFPTQNTILFPYRRKKVERRGYTEESFQCALNRAIANYSNLMVIGDVSILTTNGTHPYEPDIAIVEKNFEKGFRIDIEIDEPYTGYERKPIHYIGCGDNFRDQVLINHGWIVVRFSEKQIYNESSKCIAYITYLINSIYNRYNALYEYPTYEKKWTENEARILGVQKYREKLLNHEFGQMESASLVQTDITQTEAEKKASKEVKSVSYNLKTNTNLDYSHDNYTQDAFITFDPSEHIYLYKGREFASISTIVSKFFREFDSTNNSKRIADREGVTQIEIMERWDAAGDESREVGTFMHAQIESILNNQVPQIETHYHYRGQYVKIDEDISVEKELLFFRYFMRENQIHPYRTEWRICDEEFEIAGTIDLLCKNGNDFEIYDWKRSRKAQPDETIWAYGKNGLEHIPDISFYHYALQQNLYKYILEKNYGIHVSKMHIVIFHPIYDSYKLYEIPNLSKEVKIILYNLKYRRLL